MTALVAGGRRWTWPELEVEVSRWCARLTAHGVERGSRIAALSGNRPELVFLIHAAWRLGAVWAPLNARLTAAELQPLAARLGATCAVAEDALRDRLPGALSLEELAEVRTPPAAQFHRVVAGADALQLDGTGTGDGALQLQGADAGDDAMRLATAGQGGALPDPHFGDDAAVLFTSGTTGAAKAARLTRANFVASARASEENLPWSTSGSSAAQRSSSEKRAPGGWLLCMPLFHVGGLAMVHRARLGRAPLVLQGRLDPGQVRAALEREATAHLSVVPTQLGWLLEHDRRPPPATLRAVLVGGGPVPADLLCEAKARGWPVLQTYGLTEACSQVTTERPSDADGTTAGLPLPGTGVRITDGEIEVRGPTVMRGYLGEDAGFTADGWLRTGDLGELDHRGRLRILARRLDLIVTGGENVYPPEVEAVLAAHPAVRDAAVVPLADATWGQAPVALWSRRSGRSGAQAGADLDGQVDAAALAAWCRARLAGFKVPRHFLPVAEIPRNAAGKVDRARARALVLAFDRTNVTPAAPPQGKHA